MTSDSDNIFKALYENSLEAVVAASRDMRILSLNPTAERLFGYASDELTGRRVQVIQADARTHTSAGKQSAVGKVPQVLHYRTRTGRVFDGETREVTIQDAAGNTTAVMWIIRDVTERQSLRARLEVSDLQLRAALLSANEGSYSLNLDTGIGSIQGFLTEFLGVASNQASMSQDRWLEVVHVDDRDRFLSAFDAVARNPNTPLNLVYRAQRLDSVWRWLHFRGRVTEFGRDGNAMRVSGIVSDVTEREELETRLAASERRLANAVEAGSCGVWEIAADKDKIIPLGEIRDMIGLPPEPETVARKLWHDQIDPAGLALLNDTHARLECGEIDVFDVTYQMRDVRTDKWRWIRSRGKLLSKTGGLKRVTGILTDVTEQKTLELQLADKESLLREALESANGAVWSLNAQTGQLQIVGFLADVFGVGENGAVIEAADWVSHLEPNFKALAERQLESIKSAKRGDPPPEESQKTEYLFLTPKKKKIWLRYHGRVVEWDSTGRPLRVVGTVTDVTEERRLRDRAEQSEREFSEIVDSARIGVWRWNVDKSEVQVRGSVAHLLFGQADVATVSTGEWMKRIHPDDVHLVRDSIDQLSKAMDGLSELAYRMKGHDGNWNWYRTSGRLTDVGENGKGIVCGGVIFDITENMHLSSELNVERSRFEKIYRATPAMMHSINADGRINEVSDYWLSHLGYQRDEVIGRPSVDFLDEESRERAESTSLPELWETGMNTNIPYRFIRKDGEFVDVLLSSFLERDQQGVPLFSFAVMTDITPLKSAYEQLERTNRELDRFATVASHDLQEPLRKISAFSSLIQKRYVGVLDEDGVRSLSFLVDAAERMQKLITDLLEYSKLASQPLQVESVDMKGLFDEVLQHLDSAIRESEARIEIGQLPEIHADRTLLGQVFQNLVGNAVKYRTETPPLIVVGADQDDEFWTVWVKDNGIGMDPKFAEKVFMPFQRLHTRGEYPGTGIGLAIVQQAIDRHGGRTWVESQPGEGSTFYFSLPCTRASDVVH